MSDEERASRGGVDQRDDQRARRQGARRTWSTEVLDLHVHYLERAGRERQGPRREAPTTSRAQMARVSRQRAGRQVRLQTLNPGGPDRRGMRRAGRQLEPIARAERHVAADVDQVEGDRATRRDEDLVIAVAVRRVRVAGAVARATRLKPPRRPRGEVARALNATSRR